MFARTSRLPASIPVQRSIQGARNRLGVRTSRGGPMTLSDASRHRRRIAPEGVDLEEFPLLRSPSSNPLRLIFFDPDQNEIGPDGVEILVAYMRVESAHP